MTVGIYGSKVEVLIGDDVGNGCFGVVETWVGKEVDGIAVAERLGVADNMVGSGWGALATVQPPINDTANKYLRDRTLDIIFS